MAVADVMRTADGSMLAVLANESVSGDRFYAGYDSAADRLVSATGQQPPLSLASLKPGVHPIPDTAGIVYNLEVEDTHTFFVGKQQVLVHNK